MKNKITSDEIASGITKAIGELLAYFILGILIVSGILWILNLFS